MNFLKTVFFSGICLSSFVVQGQNPLRANGQTINNERCIEIKYTSEDLEATKELQSAVLEATIIDDCIELKIRWGGCDGNIEFVTDGKIVSSPKPKMNFKLNWIEPSTCKALMEVLVTFDLSAYKKNIQENKAIISILGTDVQLKYKN